MNLSLTIGWLYPELMSTYGDRGNITVLKKRAEWRGIKINIVRIEEETRDKEIEGCDMVIGGGSQDYEQEIAVSDLLRRKHILKKMFDRGVPGLFVCGSPQLLGEYYVTGEGKKLPGLHIFDYYTEHPGNKKPRLIGNCVGHIPETFKTISCEFKNTVVGFENHGGRTYLGKSAKAFAHVVYGNGNNGTDKTEGAVYNNVIACYFHGPLLPKNPHIADYLIVKALEVKYGKSIELAVLPDELEWKAHRTIVKKYGA